MSFDYADVCNYYDYDYWNTKGVKSGYSQMSGSLGGEWHNQACKWFNSGIPVKGKDLLDVGCGLGHFMIGFGNLGAFVSGVDASNYCYLYALKRTPFPVYQTTIETMNMISPDSQDIIFCASVLEHIPQEHIQRALLQMLRVTRPGGLIYMEIDTIPDDRREFPEESHVNIRPPEEWYNEFMKPIYKWVPQPHIETDLRNERSFPGFPLADWRFMVFRKL